jgi:hypothetical protein
MNSKPLRIFIGWDSREAIAYHVLANSILRHASGPVAIIPLVQSQLREKALYTRERGKFETTEFSLTRFLVPYLSDYGDYSIFMDCDMLCQGDVYELVNFARKDQKGKRVVWCVQHDYTPKTMLKMDNQVQTMYPRKNWSSVMVFRNKFCERLTPQYVNTATGVELHRMEWAGSDPRNIGALPKVWNWLVEEYEPNAEAKLLHFTLGGPWFFDHRNCDHAGLWHKELDLAFPSLNMPRPKELASASV